MIMQKGEPAFREFWISRRFAHPTGNGSLRNIETEHEKLTVDAGCSPVGFSATILKIKSRISFEICLLPTCPGNLKMIRQ
jgi:hypothetical protein